MGVLATVLLALLALAEIKADDVHHQYWNQLIPEGKEVIYEYKALVKAGTHIPHPFASQFLLNGKLHIQLGSTNELLVRLDDLEFELDNGKESEIRHSTQHTSDLIHITKPFKILYEDTGVLKEIVTEEDESEYSLNMKKALASMLQMNWEKVALDSVKPHAFSTKEKSIFGIHTTVYNVVPEQNVLRINRMHYSPSFDYLYTQMITDFKPLVCEASPEEIITHDSQKLYIIDRKDPKHNTLKYMESNGGVYFHPYQAKSTPQFIYVNQTFSMLEIIDKKVSMTIQKEHKHTSLKCMVTEHFEKVSDPKTLIPVIDTMLNEMAEFMKEDKINAMIPDLKKGQLIDRLVKVLSHLDVGLLEEIFSKLSTKTDKHDLHILKIFQQLLPMIGTPSSLKFVLKLVQGNKLREQAAIELLQNMPFNLKQPSVQLITDLEGMLHLTNAPWSIQKVAILSFGTLLYKLHDVEVKQDIKNTEIFEKYIEQFINKLKTSEKLEEKCLYLDTLFNMNNDLIIKHVEPIVKGEWFNDNKLRSRAMLTLFSVLKKDKYHLKMFELYWPILTDRSLPSIMRIMAFHYIMESKPSISYQINIYSFMQHEKDVDFLNFYYTYLKSLTESKNPCLYKSKLQAKQLLLYWPISYVHSLTQFRKIDIMNWYFNHGQTHDLSFINTKEALLFSWNMNINAMHLQTSPNSLAVKITGLDKRLLEDFHLRTEKGMSHFDIDELYRLILASNKESFQIVIMQMRYQQIIETHTFDKHTISNLSTYIKLLYDEQFSENRKSLQIHYDMMLKMLVPTDIGFPVLFQYITPSIHLTTTKLFKDHANNMINVNIDNKYKISDYTSFGLSFHNPFASVWQGIERYMHYDMVVPVYLSLSINPQQNVFKLTWKRHQDKNEDVYGYRSYAATYVFVHDYLNKKILQTINPSAKNYIRAAHEDSYKHNTSLIDTEEYNVGYKYQLRLFNDQNPKYYQKFPVLQDYIWGTEPISQKVMKFLMMRRYIERQPDVVERGIMLRVEPSEQNPVTSIDLVMRFSREIMAKGHSIYQPGMKINTRATYSIKKENQALKTWDIIALWDLNDGHTVNSLKLEISRMIPGKADYKICAQGTEKYSEKDLTGRMSITMGQSTDGKCKDDETAIHLTMKGEQLPEQKKGLNNFDVCHQPVIPLIKELRPFSCYADRSTLRYYTIDVKTVNFPAEFNKIVMNYWRPMVAKYNRHYVHFDVVTPEVSENNLKIQLRFPITKEDIDMRFITTTDIHKFKGLPAKDFASIGLFPDNLYYSNINHFFHSLGLTDICLIDGKDLTNMKGNAMPNILTNEWTLVLADSLENTKYGLWVKFVDDKLAMKFSLQNQILLIVPHGEKYTVTLDGKDLGDVHTINQDHFSLTKMEDSNTLVHFNRCSGAQVIYNGYQILIELPRTDVNFVGKCVHMKQ